MPPACRCTPPPCRLNGGFCGWTPPSPHSQPPHLPPHTTLTSSLDAHVAHHPAINSASAHCTCACTCLVAEHAEPANRKCRTPMLCVHGAQATPALLHRASNSATPSACARGELARAGGCAADVLVEARQVEGPQHRGCASCSGRCSGDKQRSLCAVGDASVGRGGPAAERREDERSCLGAAAGARACTRHPDPASATARDPASATVRCNLDRFRERRRAPHGEAGTGGAPHGHVSSRRGGRGLWRGPQRRAYVCAANNKARSDGVRVLLGLRGVRRWLAAAPARRWPMHDGVSHIASRWP